MTARAINREELRAALAEADPALLLMSVVHMTGDLSLLDRFRPHLRTFKQQPNVIPETLAVSLRSQALDLLAHGAPPDAALEGAALRRMMETLLAEPVPPDYQAMLLDIARLEPASRLAAGTPPRPAQGPPVVIVGAGTSGICMAVYLQRAGIPFVIVDKNPEIGGTWWENTYPGCGVDTASHFYTFSFAPNPDWPRYFSLQPDIMRYLHGVVDRFGLRSCLRLETMVSACVYDEAAKRWIITVRDAAGREETLDARALVSAVGQLNIPAIPEIPGLASFAGPVVHTGAWDRDLDLKGKRVALIGTGSSSLQVGPTIAPQVTRLTVFQRSPQWLSHKPDYHAEVPAATRWAFRHIPHYAQWFRLKLAWQFGDTLFPALLVDRKRPAGVAVSAANDELRAQWEAYIRDKTRGDPDLLAGTLPDFPPLAKRVPVDNGWFEMLRRENVGLVRKGVAEVRPGAVVDNDGVAHEADVIILATGFQASRMLQTMDIRGRGGRALRDAWDDDNPRANLGVTVPGFPNLFVLYGPNTNLGHGGNIIFHAECQANYIIACLDRLAEAGKNVIECRPEAYESYVSAVDARIRDMVWTWPGVSNWFKNSKGRVTTNSPWRIAEYWAMTRDVDLHDYVME